MGRREHQYNKHHLIWQEYREYFHINDHRNIKYMKMIRHRWLHTLFDTLNTPKDQLAFLKELFNPILSETSQELFENLLSQTDIDFYAKWLVK